MIKTPNLNDIYLFCVIADAKSITAASKILNITKQALSKRIANYEDNLGVKLIARNTRCFELTQAGEKHLSDCKEVIESAQSALSKVKAFQDTSQGVLRVHLPEIFHSQPTTELLAGFLAQNSGIKLDLVTCKSKNCLFNNGVDVEIRLGKLDDCSLVARPLGKMDFVHVTKAEQDQPMSEHSQFISINNTDYDIDCQRRYPQQVSAANFILCKKLILAGFGHGIIPYSMCKSELDSGSFQLLNDTPCYSTEINLIFLKNKFLPNAARLFINYMADQSEQNKPWLMQPTHSPCQQKLHASASSSWHRNTMANLDS